VENQLPPSLSSRKRKEGGGHTHLFLRGDTKRHEGYDSNPLGEVDRRVGDKRGKGRANAVQRGAL